MFRQFRQSQEMYYLLSGVSIRADERGSLKQQPAQRIANKIITIPTCR
jgi:hypothetical protein